jgi:hypothetical protein
LFKATIDDPGRFKDSKAVAAHLGLTPRVYQSGEIDRSGHISKCGDKLMRHALFEAANSHLAEIQEVVDGSGVGCEARQTRRREEGMPSRLPESWRSSCIECGWKRQIFDSGNRLRRRLHKDRPGVAICSAEDVGKVSPSRSLYGARIKHALSAWTT